MIDRFSFKERMELFKIKKDLRILDEEISDLYCSKSKLVFKKEEYIQTQHLVRYRSISNKLDLFLIFYPNDKEILNLKAYALSFIK